MSTECAPAANNSASYSTYIEDFSTSNDAPIMEVSTDESDQSSLWSIECTADNTMDEEGSADEMGPEDAPKVSTQLFYEFESSDKKVYEISAEAAKQSKKLSELIEIQGSSVVKTGPILLNNISSAYLKLAIEWCEDHKDDAIPEENSEMPKMWNENFLEIDDGINLYELIQTANFLEIESFQYVVCKAIYNFAKGKSPFEPVAHKNDEDDEEVVVENEGSTVSEEMFSRLMDRIK